jgi:hypothetical protein
VLPALVFSSGVIFSLYLQTLIPGEVYTVGDAGLKALLTRQLSRGVPHFDLRLPAEPWVRALWDGGLYPFESPNVVAVGDERFITFPFTFSLISAPFYRLFGFRGLYVLPLASLWLVWASLWVAGRGLRLGGVVTAAVLAAVIFASPLTWYSATFWEHTLAVALAFQGLTMALATPAGRLLSPRASFAAGTLLGASVWLREELLCLVGLMVGLALAAPWLAARGWVRLSVRPRRFLAGLLLPPALFLLANGLVYGHLLGLHGAGALKSLSRSQWTVAVVVLRGQLVSIVEYFPVLLIGLLGVPVLVASRRRALGNALLFLALAVAFGVAVPLLVRTGGGRQWGPRFLLVLVPLLALASGLTLKRAMRLGRPWGWVSITIFAVFFLGGAWLNACKGTAYLRANYQRRMIPFLFVRQHDARFVVVSHESVAAQLAGTFDRKTYFLATHGMDLRLLARELASHGESRFLYLCYPPYGCGPFGEDVGELTFYTGGGRPFARFSSRGAFDRYLVYEVACWPKTTPSERESP